MATNGLLSNAGITPLYSDQPSSYGYAKMIMGCMWAGKTSELFRIMEVLEIVTDPCHILKIKPKLDDKRCGDDYSALHDNIQRLYYNSVMRTHTKHTTKAISTDTLMILTKSNEYQNAKYIFIDEGQFFPDLKEFVFKCKCWGKHVYIAALNGDFKQNAFPSIAETIPICSDLMLLHGICHECKVNPSSYSVLQRDIAPPKGQILVGGQEKYVAVCDKCLLEPLGPTKLKRLPATPLSISPSSPDAIRIASLVLERNGITPFTERPSSPLRITK